MGSLARDSKRTHRARSVKPARHSRRKPVRKLPDLHPIMGRFARAIAFVSVAHRSLDAHDIDDTIVRTPGYSRPL
jgi:hypothetical protein